MSSLGNVSKDAVRNWLISLGFSEGNPFETVEADRERHLLPKFFVEVPEYDRIQGPKSTVVFAPRGGGKSALRVMLADKMAPREPSSLSLAVEFIDFDPLIQTYQKDKIVDFNEYIDLLLKYGAAALLNTYLFEEEDGLELIRHQKAKELPFQLRMSLAEFILTFHPHLLSTIQLLNQLHNLHQRERGNAPQLDWIQVYQKLQNKNIATWLRPLWGNELANLIADINDAALSKLPTSLTPSQKLQSFVELILSIGYQSVIFLVDRVDEYPQTANNPLFQAALLSPLLERLNIIEMPNVSFKFFLASNTILNLTQGKTLRRDRLQIEDVRLRWDDESLKRMLEDRLQVYSPERLIQDLSQICDSPKTGQKIEENLIRIAAGSPRRLLLAAQQLCNIHVRQNSSTDITLDDWQEAEIQNFLELSGLKTSDLEENTIPLTKNKIIKEKGSVERIDDDKTLILRLDFREAIVGKRSFNLSELQAQILATLIAHGGRCSRDELAQAWGKEKAYEVSEQTIDRNMSRLRKKLSREKGGDYYLETIKGWGYALKNYIIGEPSP